MCEVPPLVRWLPNLYFQPAPPSTSRSSWRFPWAHQLHPPRPQKVNSLLPLLPLRPATDPSPGGSPDQVSFARCASRISPLCLLSMVGHTPKLRPSHAPAGTASVASWLVSVHSAPSGPAHLPGCSHIQSTAWACHFFV